MSGVTFSVDAFTLGQSATGTITLQSPAPAGGTLVTLANGNSDALDCPATVTVPAGQSRATFTVTGKSVGVATTVKVEATPSFNEKSDTITVNPAFDVSVADFVLGGTGQGQVTLSAPAPAGGAVVSLSASSLRLSVPATVTVPEGGTTASFTVSSYRHRAKRSGAGNLLGRLEDRYRFGRRAEHRDGNEFQQHHLRG